MKRWLKGICIAVFLLGLLLPRASGTDLTELQQDAVDTSALEDAAPEELQGVSPFSLSDLNSAWDILRTSVSDKLSSLAARCVRSAALLLLIVFFCSMADTLAGVSGGMTRQAVRLAGAGGVALVALSDMQSLIGMGKETIEALGDFTAVLVPTLTAAAVASGSATAAPVRQTATVLCSGLLTRLINSILVPLTYAYAGTAVASCALDHQRLQPLCKLLHWVIVTVLTSVLLVYTGYITVAGAVTSAADASAVKAAQLAISGMVPVVGGILSNATETIFSGAAILRSSIGLFGMLGVLLFCMVPFLRLGLQFLIYKLVAAFSAIASNHPCAKLVQDLGSVFSLMLAMTGACALVVLISLITTISAVVP